MNYLQKKDVKTLLYNYDKYLKEIDFINEQIKEYEKKYNFLGSIEIKKDNIESSHIYNSDFEKKINEIDKLNIKKLKLEYITKKIDDVLDIISTNKYNDIIVLKYFEKLPINDILNKLDISYRTYCRYNELLIQEIKSLLIL